MTSESDGKARAETFRTEHALGLGPLGDLVTIIEQAQGLDVAILDAEPDEHGMTMRDPAREVAMIAVARTRNPMRQRSTLAHELGHVLFGDYRHPRTRGWSDRSPEEIRADAFARHLLVPIQGLRDVLGSPRTLHPADLSALVQRFLASPAVIAIQLHQARYIDAARKQDWMSQTAPALAARFGWLDQYHALQQESDTRRAPQRLLARATQGYVANVVSLEAIARLRGTTPEEVAVDFTEAGITPEEPTIVWADLPTFPRTDDDFSDLDALDAADAP
jgi:Zn-dependent peptidase ImmA (M78 family)